MYWLEISVVTDGEGAEAVSEVLRPFAYGDGVVLEQRGDPEDPRPDAMEPEITVKIYVSEEQDSPEFRRRIEEVLYHLGRLYPLPPPSFKELKDEDWANAWKAYYHPFRIGERIWIQPTWIALDEAESEDKSDRLQPEDILIVLDPGLAFGTGLHPSTQMCLQALEQVVKPGDSLFDVGTGSGILSIAAAKLGAASLLAIDIDDVAVKTAVENFAQNKVESIVTRHAVLTDVNEKGWNVVIANILAPVIIGLLEQDGLMGYVAPDGYLVLSGIIDKQAADVETAVSQAGGRVVQTLTVRDWVTFIVQPQ